MKDKGGMDKKQLCRHFGICGGCRWQDVPYDEQLNRKRESILHLMRETKITAEVHKIHSSSPWFYRNKMEFTFSEEEGELICGLHRRDNKRKVFNLHECLIFSPIAGMILFSIRQWAQAKGYLPYNKFSHRGFLRHLLVRETKFTGEVMVALVTTSENVLDTEGFVNTLLALPLDKKISSVQWVLNDSFGDAVIFQKTELIYGDPFITEKIGHLKFRIYINSFFQTNPAGVGSLYSAIKTNASLSGKEKVLDLYSGIGSIALFLADKAGFVWGVEVVEGAVKNAEENARINGIKNVSFVNADVRKFLANAGLQGKIDRVVVNPPRSGLSRKVKQRLLKVEAPFIFYSSCNPHTLFADLKELSDSGKYSVEFLIPFDFFPHTPHIEVLAVLKQKV